MSVDLRSRIRRFIEGDNDAFYEIHEVYKDRVWAYVLRRSDNREDAEDIFNNISMTVACKLSYLQDESKLVAWVFGIANKKVSEFYRKKPPKFDSVEEHRDSIAEKTKGPDDTLGLSQELAMVEQCVHHLPEPQRTYFTLQHYGEVPQKDIADAYKVNLNSLKSHIFRAKYFILNCLKQKGIALSHLSVKAV